MMDCDKYQKNLYKGTIIFFSLYAIGYIVDMPFVLSGILVVFGFIFGFILVRPYLECLEKNNFQKKIKQRGKRH